ncbi:uncharacterized protein LOC119121266 isoform X2 [Syngnathus acus]|uniref:uncharacterized protein LOC119121266 isoform X2 n=1 Tax=Syngnathus acus TaxID=161584 RepID=UPI0018861043|nr:uncharacterized protein LOC119121266 isoform X2 [Syngnathus acus]
MGRAGWPSSRDGANRMWRLVAICWRRDREGWPSVIQGASHKWPVPLPVQEGFKKKKKNHQGSQQGALGVRPDEPPLMRCVMMSSRGRGARHHQRRGKGWDEDAEEEEEERHIQDNNGTKMATASAGRPAGRPPKTSTRVGTPVARPRDDWRKEGRKEGRKEACGGGRPSAAAVGLARPLFAIKGSTSIALTPKCMCKSLEGETRGRERERERERDRETESGEKRQTNQPTNQPTNARHVSKDQGSLSRRLCLWSAADVAFPSRPNGFVGGSLSRTRDDNAGNNI